MVSMSSQNMIKKNSSNRGLYALACYIPRPHQSISHRNMGVVWDKAKINIILALNSTVALKNREWPGARARGYLNTVM